jgi:hypothetical protein
VFWELSQDNKVQDGVSGFDLVNGVIERITEGGIVFDILISSGTPQSKTMISENTNKSDTSSNKSGYKCCYLFYPPYSLSPHVVYLAKWG